MTTEKQIEKGISDIVGCLTDPIIVFPGGWGDTLPQWLKTAITLERLMENVKSLKCEGPTGTDAEACAYLMTVSLTQPVDNDWSQIYLYVANQVYTRHRSQESGVQMPEDIRVESLNDYQLKKLKQLKEWIHQARFKARKEKDRAERRENQEKVAATRKVEQPALFDF